VKSDVGMVFAVAERRRERATRDTGACIIVSAGIDDAIGIGRYPFVWEAAPQQRVPGRGMPVRDYREGSQGGTTA